MTKINYNERSWAIDLITDINLWLSRRDVLIKRAGGENTLKDGSKSLFPDVLLFGDVTKGSVLQGWELKMPDTAIDDEEFISNAKKKAKLLSLNSFLLWNVSVAVLYGIEEDDSLTIIKRWNNLSDIKTREEVIQRKEQIDAMLFEILNDINDFISSGKVHSTSVISILSSEAISELIQSNLGSYVEAIKNAAGADISFSNEITLWWRYAKNDYPEEEDKFVVMARNNLLFLVNKFLFAHILKSYQSAANIVDSINHDTGIKAALSTLHSISEKCDFWNIFEAQKGEDLITENTWQNILNFNDLLKEFNFSSIEKSILHNLIELTVYKNKRKFAGQFTTPIPLAALMAKLTIEDKSLAVLDPCCGTGTIVKEIYKFKKEKLGPQESLSTIWGSDKFSLPLQMAMFNLADPEALGGLIMLFKKDATELRPDEEIEFHEPFSGKAVLKKIPKFSYILSNLPFVQQEDLEVLNPDAPKINELISEKVGKEYALDGRSDLYAYLPFYFWSLLADDGRISVIVSNSWLGTAWGGKFYRSLSMFFKIENVLTSGDGRWFTNAKVVTNVITLKKRGQPEEPSEDEITKFSTTRQKLSSYTAENIDELVALIASKNSVDEKDISIRSYTHKEMDEIGELGLNLNSFFSDNKWILKFDTKLINISQLFEVARGERRGWDKLFYPESKNGVEGEYLKPVLKTPRSISTLIAEPDAIAFCCDKSLEELSQLGHAGALNWIKKFENQSNEIGIPLTQSLARAGTNWYTMQPLTMGEMVTSVNFGDRLFFARFKEPTFVNQRLIRFTRKEKTTNIRLCHALMNSILGLFYIEAMGTGRGEGALDLSKDKIENDFRIINPELISEESTAKILSLFEALEARDVLPIEEELKQKDRTDFDAAVLGAIGCTEYAREIKDALLNLYRIRCAVNS